MDYDGLLELLKKRRSVRRLKPDPIPDEVVNKVIEAGRWAPSGANSQPWEFLVVKRRDLKEQVMAIIDADRETGQKLEEIRPPELQFGMRPGANIAEAPVFILLLGDERTEDAFPMTGKVIHAHDTFISSQASAFLCMHLAAASLGLGSRWVSAAGRVYLQPLIKNLLGVPQDLQVYDMMALGYPAAQPKPRPVRPLNEVVHVDGYDRSKYRSDEQVRQFIVSLRRGE